MWMPPAASGPVLTVIRPILSGAFCATVGIGKAAAPAAAAVDCRNLRRLMRADMSFLPGACPIPSFFLPARGGRPGRDQCTCGARSARKNQARLSVTEDLLR